MNAMFDSRTRDVVVRLAKSKTIYGFRCAQCGVLVVNNSTAHDVDVWAVFTHYWTELKGADLCCSKECGEAALVVRALEEC